MGKKKKCIEENCGNLVTRGSKLGRCRSCAAKDVWKRPDYREKITEARTDDWAEGVYKNRKNPWKDNPELCAKRSDIAFGLWQDPAYVAKRTASHQRAMQDPEFKDKQSMNSLAMWKNPKSRERLLKSLQKMRDDPECKRRRAETMAPIFQSEEWKAAHTFHGEDNPNWQGGISLEPYGPDFNDDLKLKIRARDGFCCQLCSEVENGRAHDCHHINYEKQDNDEENLVTLCQKCHRKTNTNREYWQAYFTGENYHLMLGAC